MLNTKLGKPVKDFYVQCYSIFPSDQRQSRRQREVRGEADVSRKVSVFDHRSRLDTDPATARHLHSRAGGRPFNDVNVNNINSERFRSFCKVDFNVVGL